MAVGCEVAVQGRDILHCDSVEPGDDHSRGSEHSESGKKPTGDGHVDHDTKESMLGDRLNHYRDLGENHLLAFHFVMYFERLLHMIPKECHHAARLDASQLPRCMPRQCAAFHFYVFSC